MREKFKLTVFLSLLLGISTFVISLGNGFGDVKESKANIKKLGNSNFNEAKTVIPVRLQIPSIGVDTQVEELGEDLNGNMDTPKNDDNAGWWKYGAVPGEMGSVVIAGHIDKRSGGPAIFYRISRLIPGDEIFVTNFDNRTFKYKVIKSFVFEDEYFPTKLVFGKNDKKRLNLITCAGYFDNTQENYLDRLVVFAEMEE